MTAPRFVSPNFPSAQLPSMSPHRARASFGLALVLALTAGIYYPGLHGGFTFDDFPNIVQNTRLQTEIQSLDQALQAAFSTDSGLLKRPITVLSFWLNYSLTGLDPFFFKLTNLCIHLINGVGLFLLARLLLSSPAIQRKTVHDDKDSTVLVALTIAALWLVHPLNLTSVLYVVQRMTSLSATFVILALNCYAYWRHGVITRGTRFPLALLGTLSFGALAILSKESGALLLLYLAVMEVTLFKFSARDALASLQVKLALLICVAAPIAIAAGYLATHPEWIQAQYQTRSFSLPERLMTEGRVLWTYLYWALAPSAGRLGLYHDDIAISRSLLDPPTTLLSILALIALGASAIKLHWRMPLLAFGALWYLAGHTMESSIIGLELAHEHRNYLPIFGPIFFVAAASWRALEDTPVRIKVVLASTMVLALSGVTLLRAVNWASPTSLSLMLATHHPDSARSNHEAGLALAATLEQNPDLAPFYYAQAKQYFERAAALDPDGVSSLFSLILLDSSPSKPVDPEVLGQIRGRLTRSPLRLTVTQPFRLLVGWIATDRVTVTPHEVLSLFDAALSNETASARTRATLLSILSAYHYNVLGNAQEAVSLALAAVDTYAVDAALQISLADLALKLDNFDLAKEALEAAKRSDHLGRFAFQIRQAEKRLSLTSTPSAAAHNVPQVRELPAPGR